jgi:hypothetical protein
MPYRAEHWRAQAAEAVAAGAQMTDPEMRRMMWRIAFGYRVKAERAERLKEGHVQFVGGLSYGPEALQVVGQAFDEAWSSIAGTIGDDPVEVEAMRIRLANALLSVASEDSRDATVLKNAALQALALKYL